jgi:hypothetical protein
MGPYANPAELRHAGFADQHDFDAEVKFTAMP